MFKGITTICLLVTVLFSNTTRWLVYAEFNLNRTYIESTLCENRDRPELDCRGKCVLKKKLQQAEEREKKQEQDAQKKNFQENFIDDQEVCFVNPSFLLGKNVFFDLSFLLPKRSFDILHPPRHLSSLIA